MKPSLVDCIFIHSEDHRVLYLNPVLPDWITINERYQPIFNLFDGTNEEEDIFNFIENNYNTEKNILLPQIKEIIYSSGIFKSNNDIKSELANPISKISQVYLTLTDHCNLNCAYCYAVERNKEKDVSFETWKKYINAITVFAGNPTFTFTGGEPLTLSYTTDLALITKENKCKNILLTNGTLINSKNVKSIVEVFDLVKISLDSVDEETSKKLRGSGIIEKVRYAYNLLKSNNCDVQIMSTITSENLKNLKDFFKYFDTQVIFQPLYNMGRARKSEELSITGDQYYKALTENSKFELLHGYIDSIKSFKNNPMKRCAMADAEISIDPNGNVFPCHMLHYDNMICGNLNNQTMEDIYNNSPILRKLRTINVDNLPQCKSCVFRNFCGGGCRARNDIPKYGVEGYSDFCNFEKREILDALMYSYG